jgi:hypothetical protein
MLFLNLPFEFLEFLQLEVRLPRLRSWRGPALHHGSSYSVDGSVDTRCLLRAPSGRVFITHEALLGWVNIAVGVRVSPPKEVVIVEEVTQVFRAIEPGIGSGCLALVGVDQGLLLVIQG